MNIINEFRRVQRRFETADGLLKTTSYCDLGSAIYTRPDQSKFAVIASPTAITNMLEGTIIKREGEVIDELRDLLPVARIKRVSPDYPESYVTSLDISHRLVSSWFMSASKLVTDGVVDKATGGFGKQLIEEIRTKGLLPAIVYYCPNTVLHGFMMTAAKEINTNYSKQTGLIEGSLIAENLTRIMNSGVSFDKVIPSSSGVQVEGLAKGNKLSSMALGHIPISESHYIQSDEIDLSLRVNYKGIRRLPLADEVRDMLCDLANFQVGSLLSEEIEVRRDTTLFPSDDQYFTGMDELTERLRSSLQLCRELGYINPDPVTEFLVNLKSK